MLDASYVRLLSDFSEGSYEMFFFLAQSNVG